MEFDIRQHYSPEVKLTLLANGQTISLSRLGPDYVVPRSPLELPVCRGEVVMSLDGQETRWNVQLMNGAVPFEERIGILRATEAAASNP
jgi:hypothetical protein